MNMLKILNPRNILLLGSLLAMGIPAFGVPITGVLGFSGTSLFTFTLGPGDSYIDFAPSGTGFGEIDADNRVGFFTAVTPNEAGTIRDMSTLNNPPYAWVPINVPIVINDFLLFPSISATTNIRLTMLPLADCSGGGTCVGPFQLIQTNVTDVAVSVGLVGQLINDRNSATPDITGFTGTITAQFLGKTVAQVIAEASSPTGIVADSYSGAIRADNPIPEPATITMFGIAAVAIGFARLRMKGSDAPR